MIVRTWIGWTAAEQADAYENYMNEVAMDGYASVPGNRGVLMLRRPSDMQRVEFMMITLWDSMEDIAGFAGEDASEAVFYDRDDEFLIDRQWHVSHYDVYGRSETIGQGPQPPRDATQTNER